MSEYELNKNLVCFAKAHNDHIDVFIDKDSNLYHLDNIVSEVLYKFKEASINHFIQQLIIPDYESKFEVVGRLKKNNSNN